MLREMFYLTAIRFTTGLLCVKNHDCAIAGSSLTTNSLKLALTPLEFSIIATILLRSKSKFLDAMKIIHARLIGTKCTRFCNN